MSKPVQRRAPEPEAVAPHVLRSLTTYVKERTLSRIRSYLGRGRLMGSLPLQSLRAHWIAAYLEVAVFEDESREEDLRDLETEFDLRGLKPPRDRVAPEAARFKDRLLKEWRKRKPDDAALERAERDFEELCDRLLLEDREATRP
jgi:hypothetical protein